MKKALVAMSGGVDSAAAVILLQQAGYDCTGVTLLFTDEETKGAAECAASLGIEHFYVDKRREFREKVMLPFAAEYMSGRTPNPCMECNRHFKFGYLLRLAGEKGFDCLATGHYARVDVFDGKKFVFRALDAKKDQSYMLWRLGCKDLERIVFPLGAYKKEEIRDLAAEAGLPAAKKKDSQDICFIPDGDYIKKVHELAGPGRPGEILGTDGSPLGRHCGLECYTLGQRRGLGISAADRLYVIKKDMEKNSLVLGEKKDLETMEARVCGLSFADPAPVGDFRCTVRLRYAMDPAPARVHVGRDEAEINFSRPQKITAPGQAVVFYDGDRVLGGGVAE